MRRKLSFIIILLLAILVGCKTTKVSKLTITFDLGGSTIVSEVEEGKVINIPDDPVKDGYTFEWWYLDSQYNVELDLNYIPTSSITIYAKWIPDQYKIVFNSNGGTTFSALTINRDEVLPSTYTPTRAEYTFLGWYLDSKLTIKYDVNALITKDLTLYAKWEEILAPLMDEDDFLVDYIVTNLGEDNSKMRINYQARNTRTYLEYTLDGDSNFSNAKRMDPSMFYFESLSEAMEEPFPGRNICRVELDNLLPGKTYLYRINCGNDTYSEVYSFKTEDEDDYTDFFFITDVHYYHGFDGAEISEDVLDAALAYNPNIDFILHTGDMVDRGGNASDWKKYFTNARNLKTLPVVGVPGNHEHYYTGTTRNKIYSSYSNYPKNGIDSYKGTSFYFIHNETLFVLMDTDSPYDQGLQLEWLEDTIINNPTKFIIVGTHAPINVVESVDYNRAFMAILEKYAVDLVLAGHYHSQSYSLTYLDEKPINSSLGVAYFRGAGGGIKAIGDADPNEFAKGYIISIGDDAIIIQTITANGTLGTKYKTINKKIAPKVDASKDEIMDSFTYEADFTKEEITFSWTEKAFKNVKKITITQDYREGESFITIMPTPGYVYHTFKNLKNNLDHSYTVKVEMNDGEVLEKTFKLDLDHPMNLVATSTSSQIELNFSLPTEDNLTNIKRYDVFINGEFKFSLNAKDDSFNPITQIFINELSSNTNFDIEIEVIGRNGFMYRDNISIKTK